MTQMRQGREVHFRIPADLHFADLQLKVGEDGCVMFRWEPIERLCNASGVDPELFRGPRLEYVGELISHWYAVHLVNGGDVDPVQEWALSYADLDPSYRHRYIHKPGHA